VYLSNPNASSATVGGDTFAETEMKLDGIPDTSLSYETNNVFPTSRTLFNAYNGANVNATVGAFFNWLCDSNSYYQKETDLTTGQNYANEITNVIDSSYEYVQLNDTWTELSNTTPLDGVSGGAPNSQCDATLPAPGLSTPYTGTTGLVAAGGTDTLTYEVNGSPANIPSPAGFASGQAVDSTSSSFPSGATVTSVSGSTLTVSATVPAGTYTLYFPGMPPVLAVTNLNN